MSTEGNTPAAPATEQVAAAAEVTMQQVDELLKADEETEYRGEPEADEPAAEAAPEAPAEEPAAEPADPLDNPKGDLRVPLREERERRRQAEQRIEQLAQHQRMLGSYLEQLRGQIAPQQPQGQPEPQVPDFETDPAGHLRHQVDTLRSVLGQMAHHQQAQAQAQQAEAQRNAAVQAVTYTEAEYAKKTPDYYDAVDFMRDKLARKFTILGVPKETLSSAVARDLQQFGLKALQAGQNPAEKLFQLAKEEGYNGPRVADAQRLSTIAKGAAASRGARSTAPASNGEMGLQEAARLSYKELGKMSEDQWAKLMGG